MNLKKGSKWYWYDSEHSYCVAEVVNTDEIAVYHKAVFDGDETNQTIYRTWTVSTFKARFKPLTPLIEELL